MKRGEKISQLDLHGLFPDEVESAIDIFLFNQHKKKTAAVEIIYGIGTGVMKEKVLEFLRGHPLAKEVEVEKDGSCIIIIDY